MKNILTILTISFFFFTKAQITLDNIYSVTPGYMLNLDKFHVSGYKYTEIVPSTSVINIYNMNHTLFKTFAIPSVPGSINIYYISENLFDTDNQMEFVVSALVTAVVSPTAPPGPPNMVTKFYIFNEDGTQLFFRDSASFSGGGINNSTNISDFIFFNGIDTKMKISIQQGSMPGAYSQTELYTLPGTLPCIQCTSGTTTTTTSLQKSAVVQQEAVFYPNPVSNELKLKYSLPKDSKAATIRITDLQGKQIEELKVTNTFDYILLPSDYNNGMYLYTLIVDGKAVKTEKIILNK